LFDNELEQKPAGNPPLHFSHVQRSGIAKNWMETESTPSFSNVKHVLVVVDFDVLPQKLGLSA